MSDLPMTLLDLDAAGLDLTQPAPAEFVQFLYDNSRSGYLTLWSAMLAQPDGGTTINRWIGNALNVYYARALQTQMAPTGDKPAGENITEITYTGSTTPAAPLNTGVPVVTGPATVGGTLRCSTGTWLNDPVSYAYAWSPGGEGNTYVVQAGDAGTDVTCIVSATNSGGTTAAPPSNAIAIPESEVEAATAEAKTETETETETEARVPRRDRDETRSRREYPKRD